MFQSAPLTEARGDFRQVRRVLRDDGFQSAPLTEARGDFRQVRRVLRDDGFQSAPLTEARGDGGYDVVGALLASFNPLPSPKQGET